MSSCSTPSTQRYSTRHRRIPSTQTTSVSRQRRWATPRSADRAKTAKRQESQMTDRLKGAKIAFLATDMFEQVELTGPWEALTAAGAQLELVSLESGEIQGFNHFDKADLFTVDRTVEGAEASDYDALVLPGGVGNPDALRMNENAVRFTREFFAQDKPVGAICHAPWLLI